ncbi:MAG: DNA topoisomerase IB, partial [Terriglobia bacterium]
RIGSINMGGTEMAQENVRAARLAGLRYVSDAMPGIRRQKSGRGFIYIGPSDRRIRNARVLRRIRALVIPPAWRNVWICPVASGHLQAVGRDTRNRKQYRYHALYREHRDRTKFDRMLAFGKELPRIRNRLSRDLRLRGLPRKKVLAAVVGLLDATSVRVGNDEYARENHSFGLTTLRNGHAQVAGDTLRLHFRGKSGQEQDVSLNDHRLAQVVKRCHYLPGYRLFEYLDDEAKRPVKIHSEDVNEYLREITRQEFTAKDFRTWTATCQALLELEAAGPPRSVTAAKRNIVAAIKKVSKKLGNRPPACRKYYIHPLVLDVYAQGSLCEPTDGRRSNGSPRGLRREELAVIDLITRLDSIASKPRRKSGASTS